MAQRRNLNTRNADTRALLEDLRQAIDKALIEVINEGGFRSKVRSLSLGKCLFDHSGSFEFKLNGVFAGGQSREETNYEWLAKRYALGGVILPPLGFVFSARHDGMKHTVVGANSGEGTITLRSDGERRVWRNPKDLATYWAQASGPVVANKTRVAGDALVLAEVAAPPRSPARVGDAT